MYKEKGYDLIALTDHDGVAGVSEAMIAGEALEMQIVPGIEFGCGYDFGEDRVELHILGYHIDIENEKSLTYIKKARDAREVRNEKLLAHLNDLGFELSREDLITRPKQDYIGKPDFARALRRKGIAHDHMWEIFDQVEKRKDFCL